MEGETIICTAETGDGQSCGQVATVLYAQSVCASKMFDGEGGRFQHVLIETQYDIECPACGRRTQTVPAGE